SLDTSSKHSLSKTAYQISLYPCSVNIQVPNRHFAAAATKSAKKKNKKKNPTNKDARGKSYHYTESDPEDAYLERLYPWQIYKVKKAIHILKKLQTLHFINAKRSVYLDLTLNIALEKKKNV
ncbi:hypothetical protein HPG69_016223, partial [Diceros bicornis minor]